MRTDLLLPVIDYGASLENFQKKRYKHVDFKKTFYVYLGYLINYSILQVDSKMTIKGELYE